MTYILPSGGTTLINCNFCQSVGTKRVMLTSEETMKSPLSPYCTAEVCLSRLCHRTPGYSLVLQKLSRCSSIAFQKVSDSFDTPGRDVMWCRLSMACVAKLCWRCWCNLLTDSYISRTRCHLPTVERQLIMYYVVSVPGCRPNHFCNQDNAKNNLHVWTFAKFIADTPYVHPLKTVNFWCTSHHIQDSWEGMVQNLEFS